MGLKKFRTKRKSTEKDVKVNNNVNLEIFLMTVGKHRQQNESIIYPKDILNPEFATREE